MIGKMAMTNPRQGFLGFLLLMVFFSAAGAWEGLGKVTAVSRPQLIPPPAMQRQPQPTLPSREQQASLLQTTGLTLNVAVAFQGLGRVGSWLPVKVTAQNEGADVQGEVQVSIGHGSSNYGVALDLPKGATKAVVVSVFLPSFNRNLNVRFVQQDGQTVLAQESQVIEPLGVNTQMVATVTKGAEGLPIPLVLSNKVQVKQVALDQTTFPDQAVELSTFDTLILNAVPTSDLSEQQKIALTTWVLQGGQLVLGGGEGAQETLRGLPAILQPLALEGTQQWGGAKLFGIEGLSSVVTLAQDIPLTKTDPLAYPLYNGALAQSTLPLFIERPVGKGFVTFTAMALDLPFLRHWAKAPRFWSDLLHPLQAMPNNFAAPNTTPRSFLEGNVASNLTQIPGLELPPLLLLGLLLVTYIVLIGPVTYLVLRRLDRQAWGWLVVPSLTLIFALLAYGLSYLQRGGDVVIKQITLIEPLQPSLPGTTVVSPSEVAQVKTFVGLFSPTQRKYTLEAQYPGAMQTIPYLRPISLQGAWDMSGQEQGGSFRQALPARVANIEIAQWSMRAFLSDEVLPYAGLTASLTLDGDKLTGKIINQGQEALEDLVLLQGYHVLRLGKLAPGQRVTPTLSLKQDSELELKFGPGSPLSYLIYGDELSGVGFKGARPELSSAMSPSNPDPLIRLRSSLLDSLFSTGNFRRSSRPLLLAWSKTSPLKVVVPQQKVERQNTTLIAFEPPLHLTPQPVTLDSDWFERTFEAAEEGVIAPATDYLCMGSQGLGVANFNQPLVETLRLPPYFLGFKPKTLTLLPFVDGDWPKSIQIALFDWEKQQWVKEQLDNQPLEIEVRNFVSNNGQIRLRLSANKEAMGCFFVGAKLTGTLP